MSKFKQGENSHRTSNIKIYFLFLLLSINGMIFYTVFAEGRSGLLKVSFLDIGQGDAIFIESPSGNQLLIDAGPGKSILNALSRVMPFYDKTIDVVLATHPDADHIGGIPELVKAYTVLKYISNGATSSTAVSKELENQILDKKIETELVSAGEIIDLGGGAYLKILYLQTDPRGRDTNDYSIIAKLYYGDSTFLFTGDASTDVEEYLVSSLGKELDSDVLKVAHHGSKNSFSTAFLSAVSPEYSVISAGKDNRYGHPHKEILESLNDINSIILGTYNIGDIIFVSDGNDPVIR